MIPLLLGSGSSAHGGKAVNETICLFQNCWGAPTGDDCLGSLASYQCVRNARGMSAMPPIPTEIDASQQNLARCHYVWPGRGVQDGLPRSTNVRAASMYQASEVEQFAPGHHGYPRASDRHRCNALVQSPPVLDQLGDEIDYSWRQRARIRAQDVGQRPAQRHHTMPHDDAALDQEAADLIGHPRPLADEARAHAMQSQQVHLLRRLDRHEVHGLPLHSFRNRLGIAVVVLMTFEERLYVLRRHQTNIVSKRGELAADVMSPRAGFHSDQAAWNVGEPALKLSPRALQLPNDRPALIEADKVEAILTEIDADRADGGWCGFV